MSSASKKRTSEPSTAASAYEKPYLLLAVSFTISGKFVSTTPAARLVAAIVQPLLRLEGCAIGTTKPGCRVAYSAATHSSDEATLRMRASSI